MSARYGPRQAELFKMLLAIAIDQPGQQQEYLFRRLASTMPHLARGRPLVSAIDHLARVAFRSPDAVLRPALELLIDALPLLPNPQMRDRLLRHLFSFIARVPADARPRLMAHLAERLAALRDVWLAPAAPAPAGQQ